jgi:ATP-dependent DNA ligase
MLRIVPTTLCTEQKQLDELNVQYVADGYEGQMVRLDLPYDFDKRSKSLLKRKEFITEEFPFLRAEEGLGNWAGYAKTIFFRMPDGTEGKSGLKGNQDFAKNLLTTSKSWDGKALVTVRHFGLMPTGGYRFPVAIDFHPNGRTD